MTPFFKSPARQELLWNAAKKWEGTPFFPNAASLGHGVGCVNLINELGVETGAFERLDLPKYDIARGHHTAGSQLLPFLMEHPALKGRLVFVPFNGLRMPGDLFGILQGQIDHHLACCLKWGKIVHAIQDRGVCIQHESDDIIQRRILYVLRLMEVSA